MYIRKPQIYRTSVTTTGHRHIFPSLTRGIRVKCVDGSGKIYFEQTDFDNDTNGIQVSLSELFEMDVGLHDIYMRADAGATLFEIVSTH
jgi:hypothetical protein